MVCRMMQRGREFVLSLPAPPNLVSRIGRLRICRIDHQDLAGLLRCVSAAIGGAHRPLDMVVHATRIQDGYHVARHLDDARLCLVDPFTVTCDFVAVV